MTYTEYYKCNLCGTGWSHLWDTEDYNNDYTQCPKCFDYDFEAIQKSIEINRERIQLRMPK